MTRNWEHEFYLADAMRERVEVSWTEYAGILEEKVATLTLENKVLGQMLQTERTHGIRNAYATLVRLAQERGHNDAKS